MAKKQKSLPTEEHAVSFFGPARHFQKAADLLPASDETLRAPINVLCFHAIELALKAFLRVHNVPIVADAGRKHHRLTDLYEECRALGLKISGDDQTNIGNIRPYRKLQNWPRSDLEDPTACARHVAP